MRVLNVTGGISTNAGVQTARRLEHYFSGCDITCGIFESSNPSFEQIATDRDIETTFFGPNVTNRLEEISLLPGRGYPKAVFHAAQNISSYDIIHVYGGPLFHGPIGAMFAATSGCPLIIRFNGYVPLPEAEPKRTFVRTVVRELLGSHGVVFNSYAQKKDILSTYDVENTENHWVIPPGVDQQWFETVSEIDEITTNTDINPESFVIGSVITPRPIKRLDRTFDIIATLAESHDITYVILGDSNNLDQYKQLASKKGVGDKVHWVGHVEQQDLAKWYSLFDATILTSEWESFGMSITESYLCGTPCVAFDVGGLKDQIVHNKTGYLVEPYDIDEFVSALDQLLNDEDRSKEFGNKGREHVLKRFTLEIAADKYKNLLTSLVGE